VSAEAGPPPPRYLAGGLSEKGRRESNEDAAILAVLPPGSALQAFAVLSDGMGGHNAGEVASRLAVEILRGKVQAFASRPDAASLPPAAVEEEIREWIAEVNREIYERGKASAEQKGMGATVAFAMVLAGDRLVVANVGDSKIFLVSGLKVRQLSVDHTALAEQRRALGSDSVAPEDDASNPFAHALTRSLGQEKKVVPDVRTGVTLGVGDAVLLTTDGVTDVLEAERFLTALETTGTLQETAQEIYRLAFEAGSKDNVSVALLSRGTPTRLGLGRTSQTPVEPPAVHGADDVLVAGAASMPAIALAPRRRGGRLVAWGAAMLVLAAAIAGLVVFLRRSAPAPAPPAAAAPVQAAPASTAVLAAPSASPVTTPTPTAAPAPAVSAAPAAAPQSSGREARVLTAPRPAMPAARAPAEPSFKAPAAFNGLQPLEFPPTPTETPTATHTPTPAPTDTPTPVSVPSAPPGKAAPAAPAPRPTPGAGVRS
jgi:protein phosphatase